MVRFGFASRTLHGAALWLVGLGLACGDDSTPGATTFSSTTGSSDSTSTTTSTTAGGTSELDDTGTSDEGSSDDEVGPVCPQTHECVPVAPEGWEGPVVLVESSADDDEPACEGSYPDVTAVGYDRLVAPPAECGCSCGEAVDVSCPLTLVARYWGADSTCSENVPAQYELSTTSCNNLPAPLDPNTYWTAAPVQATGGSCEAITHESIDTARFETRVTACGGAALVDGCAEDQICTPRADEPYGDHLCVWKAGEDTCPAEYPESHALYTDVVDERACDECTCASPTGLCDSAVLTLLSQPCNAPISGIVTANGHCTGTNSNQTRSVAVNPGQPTAFCLPSEGTATGAASPDGSITVCCR
jgi:hypothetical protein